MYSKIILQTYLSPQVKFLITDLGKCYQTEEISQKGPKYLNENGILCWEKIALLFDDLHENFNIHEQSHIWFVSIIQKLWPVFLEAHSALNCKNGNNEIIWNLCSWTLKETDLKEIFSSFMNSQISVTEVLLLLTSIIDRSLGNLFLLQGENVPFLVRDLLSTPEMFSLLGQIPVLFLQVLMGTPLALNLRNIVWHGFPCPEEIYPQYVSTFFVVIASIGSLIQQKCIPFDTIPVRPQKCYPCTMFKNYLDIKEYCTEALHILYNSKLISTSHYYYWNHGLQYYKEKKYGKALLILLPQFEHILRCMYCIVNQCPERALTAESTTLYITLNEVMSETVVDCCGLSLDMTTQRNKLPEILGDPIMEILQDIFVHRHGPRIRDRLSHGETDLCYIPENLANQVICVILVTVEAFNRSLMEDHTENFLEERTLYFKNLIHSYHQSYKVLFHPCALIEKNITATLHSLSSWSSHNLPQNINLQDVDIVSNNLLELKNEVDSLLLKYGLNMKDVMDCEITSFKIRTVFRPKLESEFLNILKQVVDNTLVIGVQVTESLKEKLSLYNNHKLRSRRRTTVERMLKVIPNLKCMVYCTVCIVALWTVKINHICDLPSDKLQKIMKFFKSVIQIVENMVSYTNQNKNRWMEAQEMMKNCSVISEIMKLSDFT